MTDNTILGPYRVLDLTNETGMLCGKIFADLGAEVIKIEKPGGDPPRNIGPFFGDVADPERSLFWFAYNTNKKGITLNIETKQGQEIFKKLAGTADFVFESFPPGYLSEISLDYNDLTSVKPDIILTSITPFGRTGPYSGFKSSDLISMAMGGAMTMNGDPDRAPLRSSLEQSYTHAGSQAAAATLVAHHFRRMSGKGQHVDISIQECLERGLGGGAEWFSLVGFMEHRQGMKMERANFRAQIVFPAKDGWVSWRIFVADQGAKTNSVVRLMDELGESQEEVAKVDFRTIDANRITQDEIDRWEKGFARFFASHTVAELHREAVKRGIMLVPVSSTLDLLKDPQLLSRQYWTDVEHSVLGTNITCPGAPYKLSEAPWRISRPSPLIGEHNREIYHEELGMSNDELGLMKEQGVI